MLVGGPAVQLLPDFFADLSFVRTGAQHQDALAYVNPHATKTSSGCVRHCEFCAVPRTEGRLKEFTNWPNRPILIDNNLLGCSKSHFDVVINGLRTIGRADFNQGLDARLLTEYHTQRLHEIKEPTIRLALDNMEYVESWRRAFLMLRAAGIAKYHISSYALIGFNSGTEEARERLEFIESFGIKAFPMWFHELDAMHPHQVTEKQKALGWSQRERKWIFQWYYQHRDLDKPRVRRKG